MSQNEADLRCHLSVLMRLSSELMRRGQFDPRSALVTQASLRSSQSVLASIAEKLIRQRQTRLVGFLSL